MQSSEARFDVAIVGMSGRFPGARNLKEFWDNLAQGVESIRTFSDEELLQRGVDPEYIHASDFVKAASVLTDADRFAAPFFGYSPREAELMDPQHRLFLECAWEALEDAGYAPRQLKGTAGVFAGASLSAYMLFNLAGNPAVDPVNETFQVMVGGDKDFLCTRLSYKLNLKGPSLTVQTGCSTSLVALHLAVQSLLTYQCDIAITGGVSVGVPQRTGYHYQPGGIASPDGHCRPFDAAGQGTIFGEGIGIVILKRLEEAIPDGDHIYAVIRGSAINNDGSGKIGYTAPGVDGQADVISRAQKLAGITSNTIGYIEAHGTGTALGDPVELAALHQAFAESKCQPRSCAVGALKSNIGHLDAAAGIAGLMKTVLMLKNRQLVPTLHFQQLNPKIDLVNGPFYVNVENRPWVSASAQLRAGVSSFGIGGTNAHVILEEAPVQRDSGLSRPLHVLCLSAETETALAHATRNLANHLEQNPVKCLADVAYTLHTGREQFKYRRAVVCSDALDTIEALRALPHDRILNGRAEAVSREVAFLFPGGGTQYVGMGNELYRTEPTFKMEFDRCAEFLKSDLGYDLRNLLYCAEEDYEISRQKLLRPSAGLPAIFATEYALAKLFISWGVKPAAMIGHSLGEYAAACLAGVFSLQDAMRLVVFRGRLFESLPTGSMVSVNLSESDLGELPAGISIAAVNTPDQCVLSGAAPLIEKLIESLSARDVEFHRLHIEAAAHCSMVEPVMEQFLNFLQTIPLNKPSIPFISNLTGKWITAQEATDACYWVSHLRHTVRFSEGLQNLAEERNCAMLETGPGRTLSSFVRNQLKSSFAFSAMRHPHDTASELLTTYNTLAKLWNAGVEMDWQQFYARETRNRVSLPSYPFERESYWINPPSGIRNEKKASQPSHGYFHQTVWDRANSPALASQNSDAAWVVLTDEYGVGEKCVQALRKLGKKVIEVQSASSFSAYSDCKYGVNATLEQDFQKLVRHLSIATETVHVVHLWSLTADLEKSSERDLSAQLPDGAFCSLLYLSRALAQSELPVNWRIMIAANGVVQVSGSDMVLPRKSSLLAACTVIPQEFQNIRCSLLDFDLSMPIPATLRRVASQILAESNSDKEESPVVAYRGLQRWTRSFERVALLPSKAESPAPDAKRTYLITGGLGTLGLVVAQHMAAKAPCRLILTTRSDFPNRDDWSSLSQHHDDGAKIRRTLQALNKIEETGSEVWVRTVDVAEYSAMEKLVQDVQSNWGDIYGVIHLAGITGDKALRLISDLSQSDCQFQFRPKIQGSCVLHKIFRSRPLAFCVLFSSTASLLGGPGMLAYMAASCFLDSFAANCHLQGQRWVSIDWDGWVERNDSHFVEGRSTSLDRYALPYSEALALLDRVLASDVGGQLIISSDDVALRVAEWTAYGKKPAGELAEVSHMRPNLGSEYVAPKLPMQKQIAGIWSEILGIDQIGIYDNLFELGGNSLIGLRIVARLKKDLNIEIPVTALFEGPTICTLSRLIERKGAAENYTASRQRGELRRNRRMNAGAVNS